MPDPRGRILVVDDSTINRKLAVAFLKREGWDTDEAEDGKVALDKLAGEHGYRALLLDISMPGLSGEEVCVALRADPRHATLPIVAYTAHAMDGELQRILSAGFDDILVKPITLASLRASLAKVLGESDRADTGPARGV